jgi:hypothetical protein
MPFGKTAAPLDVVISRAKDSGKQCLCLQLMGDAQVASMLKSAMMDF